MTTDKTSHIIRLTERQVLSILDKFEKTDEPSIILEHEYGLKRSEYVQVEYEVDEERVRDGEFIDKLTEWPGLEDALKGVAESIREHKEEEIERRKKISSQKTKKKRKKGKRR